MLDALSRPSHLAGGGKGRGVGKTNKHSHSRMADPVGGRSTRTLKLVNLFLKLPTAIVHVLQHANWLINHYPASTRFRWRCWWEAGKALQDFFPLFRYNAQRLIFPAVFCFPWPALSHTPKHFPLKIKAKKKKIEGCWALLPACCFDALGRDIPTWPMRIFLTRTRQLELESGPNPFFRTFPRFYAQFSSSYRTQIHG